MPSHSTPIPLNPQPNGDEALDFDGVRYIGNFHKTLPHNKFGEVDPAAYKAFAQISAKQAPHADGNFEDTVPGELNAPEQAPFTNGPPGAVAKLVSPQAGRSNESLGPDPLRVNMPPAPGVLSHSIAAEMTELFWMARLRDTPFEELAEPDDTAEMIDDLRVAFQFALDNDRADGRLKLGLDLPESEAGGALRLDVSTLFRGGLMHEDRGPIVSQFLLHDINYGAQLISQTQYPYAANKDYLSDTAHWLLAQNSGLDTDGDAYSQDNDFAKEKGHFELPLVRKPIRNMRDLARFVNRDALHQAYFNAALLLNNWNAPLALGNPYNGYKRQTAFATLGGPNLLSLVSEVASRALKVVWRQKWLVHRRLRPEAYGGLMQMQKLGRDGALRAYGLPDWVFGTKAAQLIRDKYGAYHLPLAFSAGSPAHPAYGAGHASVAGACVTILKAWFDETQPLINVLKKTSKIDPTPPEGLLRPGSLNANGNLAPYTDDPAAPLTVLGELNKLAVNIAMGRSMGGVHWRSDNTRSLRLGEQVATIILKRQNQTYAEQPLSMSYTNFDNNRVTIADGKVHVPTDPQLEAFYDQF